MSTQSALRPQAAAPDLASLRSERRFRLAPEVIAMVAGTQAAADTAHRPQGLSGLVMRAAAILQVWRERVRGRNELAGCDLRMLRDMGVSPYEAGREVGKPFWRE